MHSRETYIGDVDIVLRHVQADGDIGEVENRADGVAVLYETLNQTNECERHVCRREKISGRTFAPCPFRTYGVVQTHRSIIETVVKRLIPSLRFW